MIRQTRKAAATASKLTFTLATAPILASIACGGSSGGTASSPPAETSAPTNTSRFQPSTVPSATPSTDEADALRRAVTAYSDAYLSGDSATAYSLLSERCQARMARSEMDAATAGAKDLYGPQKITSFHIEALQGTLARVTYRFPNSAIDQESEPWVKERGAWHEDDC